mmetsp:Transcript_22165/g.73383  ORF Transcript_22165/g.73383 Transcript_22165/m.73383 type:complete len:411 (+) Transcript_22165:2036-3268(+)
MMGRVGPASPLCRCCGSARRWQTFEASIRRGLDAGGDQIRERPKPVALDAAPRPALRRRRARRRVGLHGARGGPCAATRARAAAARPAGARDLGARRRRRRPAPDRRVPGPGRAPGHRAAVLREPRPLRVARVPGSRHGDFGALLRALFPRPPPGHRRLRPLDAGAGARGVRRLRRPADGRGVPRRRQGVAADDLPGRGAPLARGGQVDVGVPRGAARRRVFFCRRGAAQPLRLRRGRGALGREAHGRTDPRAARAAQHERARAPRQAPERECWRTIRRVLPRGGHDPGPGAGGRRGGARGPRRHLRRRPGLRRLSGARDALWLGNGGTVSALHFDRNENLMAVVRGGKRFSLFDPTQGPFLGQNEPLRQAHYSYGADGSLIRDPASVDRHVAPNAQSVYAAVNCVEINQ